MRSSSSINIKNISILGSDFPEILVSMETSKGETGQLKNAIDNQTNQKAVTPAFFDGEGAWHEIHENVYPEELEFGTFPTPTSDDEGAWHEYFATPPEDLKEGKLLAPFDTPTCPPLEHAESSGAPR